MGRAAADSARMHIGANGGYESHLRRSVAWGIIEAGRCFSAFFATGINPQRGIRSSSVACLLIQAGADRL